METMTLERLMGVLHASISPVALISGVGLLILSFSNRFGRVMDLLRELLREVGGGATAAELASQVHILQRRAHILRVSLSCAVGCALLVSLLVLCLFAIALLGLQLQALVLALFGLALACLIASLAMFLWDLHLSLKAMQAECRRQQRRL